MFNAQRKDNKIYHFLCIVVSDHEKYNYLLKFVRCTNSFGRIIKCLSSRILLEINLILNSIIL